MSGQTRMFRKVIEAAFRCNLAYGRLKGNIGAPEDALELARVARDTIPWFPAVQNTYGCALAKTGDPAAGLAIMKANQTKLREEPSYVRQEAAATLKQVEAIVQSQ